MGLNIGSNAISDLKLGSTQVEKVYLGSDLVWSSTPTPVIRALKFTSENAQTLGITYGYLGSINPNFEYSTDGGSTWTTWSDLTSPLSFGSGTDLYLRGANSILANSSNGHVRFVFSTNSPVYCTGNVMHLYDYTQDLTAFPTATGTRGLSSLFNGCTQLVTCPSLPATTLVRSAYSFMFGACRNLITLPALPATVGRPDCYNNMFNGCTSIKMSETQTGEYQNEYVINDYSYANTMFLNTGGTFTGTPNQATYYTSNTIIS